jgi:hypothetical protein
MKTNIMTLGLSRTEFKEIQSNFNLCRVNHNMNQFIDEMRNLHGFSMKTIMELSEQLKKN